METLSDGAVADVRTIRAVVSGRVQGVGFRWSCEERAGQLGLTGEVRNLEDGSVEVLAQGSTDRVGALIDWLHEGPRWAHVTRVVVTDLTPGTLRLQGFRIGH